MNAIANWQLHAAAHCAPVVLFALWSAHAQKLSTMTMRRWSRFWNLDINCSRNSPVVNLKYLSIKSKFDMDIIFTCYITDHWNTGYLHGYNPSYAALIYFGFAFFCLLHSMLLVTSALAFSSNFKYRTIHSLLTPQTLIVPECSNLTWTQKNLKFSLCTNICFALYDVIVCMFKCWAVIHSLTELLPLQRRQILLGS